MDAITFVKEAWNLTDEEQRKTFVRTNVGKVSQKALEKEILKQLDQWGWNSGLLMVAQRVLQVLPSEPILHRLLSLIAEGASFVPNGTAMRARLKANLDGLIAKHPNLVEAQRRFNVLREKAEKAVTKNIKKVKKAVPKKAAAKTKSAAKPAAKKKAPAKKKPATKKK